MCCLFGFYHYGKEDVGNLSYLTNILAENATARGTDAAGIAYNDKGKLVIHKEAKAAYNIDFKHPNSCICVTGHTRHATQGDKKKNYNNHPFSGSCKNLKFALSHNGVLINDNELKSMYHLPKSKVVTDSYVAVQLLEKKKQLNADNIKHMAEAVQGSFAFSILDSSDTLWLVRGDSPLSLVHFPKYKLYVYASTEEILYKSLVDTKLFAEVKRGYFEEFHIHPGDILSFSKNGTITNYSFSYTDYSNFRWWDYGMKDNYVEELKSVAAFQGYSPDEIEMLIDEGFTPEEIEDFIYCVE